MTPYTTQNPAPAARHAFFLSAVDRRELAVVFGGPGESGPVFVYEEGGPVSGFRPNEILFAIEDRAFVKAGNGGISLSTTLVEIRADAEARPGPPRALPVSYHVGVAKTKGQYALTYRIAGESRAALAKEGFDPDFPRIFRRSAGTLPFDPARLENKELDVEDLSRLALPPHHPTGSAETARAEFAQGRAVPPVRITADWEEPVRLAGSFTMEAQPENDGRIVVVQSLPPDLPPPGGRTPRPRR